MTLDLADQVALVTGAGKGIGRASALALAEAGAHVVVADIAAPLADATTEAIMSTQRRALAVQADVGDLQDIDRMVRQALATFGQIDILVNNAGVTRRADIMELTEEDWDRIHRVNAKGVFFCLQRVAREMIPRRSGRIINIASIAGKGYEGTSNAAYAASKGAVISLTKSRAATGQAQHQRQLGLPRRDTYRAVGRQPARSRPPGRRDRRGHGASPGCGHPLEAGRRSRGHRCDGVIPGVLQGPEHHRAILQRGWRSHPGLGRARFSASARLRCQRAFRGRRGGRW
jgi:NADP-dependent 3-hydroxy acid dehydrogenase YdfG